MKRSKRTRKEDQELKNKVLSGDGHFRYPRPLGFTYAAISAQNNKEQKEQLRETIINLYINQGMQINGKELTIQELATFLQIPSQILLLRINTGIERLAKFFEGNEGKRLARVNWNRNLQNCLETMALTKHQTQILMAQQGNEYVPFLTGEVNRSLANLINASKPIQDLIKMLIEKNQINILINNDGDSRTSGHDYISPSQVIEIMAKEGQSMYNNPQAIEAKKQELLGLPDVDARTSDLTKIGIKMVDKKSDRNPQQSTEKRHEIHRNEVIPGDGFEA